VKVLKCESSKVSNYKMRKCTNPNPKPPTLNPIHNTIPKPYPIPKPLAVNLIQTLCLTLNPITNPSVPNPKP